MTTSPAEWAKKLGELLSDHAGTPDLDIADVAKFLSSLGVPVPATVTSWTELDALPDGTVVIDASGDVAQRSQPRPNEPAGWRVLGLTGGPSPSTALDLPVAVLSAGESDKAAVRGEATLATA